MKIRLNFIDILTLIFITLKLTNHITWSWIWVLSPIWIYYVIYTAIIVVVIFSLCIFSGVSLREVIDDIFK
jgi:hypothetical protein